MTIEEKREKAAREYEAFKNSKNFVPRNKDHTGRHSFYASIRTTEAPLCAGCGYAKHPGACQ